MFESSFAVVIGGAILSSVLFALTGFAMATRTQIRPLFVAVCIGCGNGLVLYGIAVSEHVRSLITLLAYIIMIGFPVYALFWILTDFVSRVVRA